MTKPQSSIRLTDLKMIYSRMVPGRPWPTNVPPTKMINLLKQTNPNRWEFELLRLKGKAVDHGEA